MYHPGLILIMFPLPCEIVRTPASPLGGPSSLPLLPPSFPSVLGQLGSAVVLQAKVFMITNRDDDQGESILHRPNGLVV